MKGHQFATSSSWGRPVAQVTGPGTLSYILESQLLGEPGYDVHVGPYGDMLVSGIHLPIDSPSACQTAFDWATTLGRNCGVDLFFEMDADGPEGQVGINCRHRGNIETACSFYRAIGEDWRSPLYRSVTESLPEGWKAVFAAVFFGRPGAPTRLELTLSHEARERIIRNPEHLSSCFEQMRFEAYDDKMLKDIRTLVSISNLNTLQFDIREDGSLGSMFAITSCFERAGADFSRQFKDDGTIGRICTMYEAMGVADGRWRLAERSVFSNKGVAQLGCERYRVMTISMPNCGKARWIGAKPQPAKLYLMQAAIRGERWMLDIFG